MTPDTASHIAVVTGASQGLGRALVRELAGRGVTVAALARDAAKLDTLVREVTGATVLPVTADVADPAEVARAFEEIRGKLGHPTILINNAAVYPRRDLLEETPESLMAVVAINLGGVIACCHEVLPEMVARGKGRIVNVATFADIRPAPRAAAYSVSKGAARIFTKSLVAELGDRFPGIVINDWIPGALATRMGPSDGIAPEDAARWGVTLALRDDRALNGLIFDRNREHQEPRSLRRRLKEKVLGGYRPPIELEG